MQLIAVQPDQTYKFAFRAYGVTATVEAESEVTLARAKHSFPPGWEACEPPEDDVRFVIRRNPQGSYDVEVMARPISPATDLQVALGVLETQLRMHLAYNAESFLFVHAGAVALDGRAIVIPGASFSGKTTLVAELVRAGAQYLSDEFTLIDDDGLVHPYPKPLSIRSGGIAQTDHDISAFGGVTARDPARVGLVVVSQYRPGARWEPRVLSPGEGMLAVLANALPSRVRSERILSTLRAALEGAVILEGDRGEASELAGDLLASVSK
jgi:hypothetical protein